MSVIIIVDRLLEYISKQDILKISSTCKFMRTYIRIYKYFYINLQKCQYYSIDINDTIHLQLKSSNFECVRYTDFLLAYQSRTYKTQFANLVS